MNVTSKFANLLYKDPRSIPSQNPSEFLSRSKEERLLARMFTDPESTQEHFIVEVPAPQDKDLACFMSYYHKSICLYLDENGEISDDRIQSLMKRAHTALSKNNEIRTEFKILEEKAKEYDEYSQFLLAKERKRVVTLKTLETTKERIASISNQRELQILQQNFKTSQAERVDHFETQLENFLGFKYRFKSRSSSDVPITAYRNVNYYQMVDNFGTNSLEIPIDIMRIYKENVEIVNFKLLDFDVTEISTKFVEEYWFEIGVMSFLLRKIKKDTPGSVLSLKYYYFDVKGYEGCINITPETLEKCASRVFNFINDADASRMIVKQSWAWGFPVGQHYSTVI